MLELRQRLEEMEHQLAPSVGSVDGLDQRSKAHPALIQLEDQFHQLLEGVGQAIELPNHQGVAGTQGAQACLQLRPLPLGAGDTLLEDLLAVGLLEGIMLQLGILVLGANTRAADDLKSSSPWRPE